MASSRSTRAAEPTATALDPVEVLIVAPHSDDEAIGCTGVILRATEKGERIGIVLVTAGDAHTGAAAAIAKKEIAQLKPGDFITLASVRQRHTLQAMAELGIVSKSISFLGYPDGGLDKIYKSTEATPYCSPFTQRSETYGIVVRDYHTLRHGKPAPYLKTSVIDDLTEIIRAAQPREIYTTNEADTHLDHRATMWFVRDAAAAAGFGGPLLTYVVHGKPPTDPPTRVLKLTDAEFARKRATIEIYQQGVAPVHADLAEKYTLPEERFWEVKVHGKR
jgi:LmbE family N-acetylglucosaminyl deacetylase